MKARTRMQLLLSAVVLIAAMNCRATTLWGVWQLAQTHAPALEQADATLAEAQAAHSTALAQLLPALTLNASRIVDNQSANGPQFYGNGIVPVSQSENTRTNGWNLELDQPLFDWHAIQNLSAADYSEAAGVARAEAARQTLMATIAQDYLAVLSAQAQLDATREAQTGFALQAMQAAARYKAGLSGIIGTDETGAALAQAQSETLAAEQALKQAQRQLDTDTGVHISGPFPALPDTIALPLPSGVSRDAYLQQALNQNPTLAAARLDQRAAGHVLSAARGGYLPVVSVVLSHQRNLVVGSQDFSAPGSAVNSPATQDASQNLIGVKLSWAIFSGGATSAAAQSAEAQQSAADASARTAELTVAGQLGNALDGITSDRQRVHQLQTGVASAQAAVSATAAAVSKGLRNEQDLVIARQTLLTLKTNHSSAVVQFMNDHLALAQALGRLTPELLADLSRQIESPSTDNATRTQPNGESSQ